MQASIHWILPLVITPFVALFWFLLPRIARRGLLFGVYVGEEASGGEEARRITKSWYVHISWWLGASLLAGFAAALWAPSSVPPISVLMLTAGFLLEYLRAHARARRLSRREAAPPAAAFVGASDVQPPFLPYAALALAISGGLYAIVHALLHFADLPESIPTHFNLAGKPDAWGPRSYLTVLALPLIALATGVFLGAIAVLTARAKRSIRHPKGEISFMAQQRFRHAMARFLAVIAILATAATTLISIGAVRVGLRESDGLGLPGMILVAALLLYAFGGSLYVALRYGQGGSRLERPVEGYPLTDGLADNRHWVLGLFYVNREDPSVLVESRFGLGYTINLGNWKAATLLFGIIGLLLIIAIASLIAR